DGARGRGSVMIIYRVSFGSPEAVVWHCYPWRALVYSMRTSCSELDALGVRRDDPFVRSAVRIPGWIRTAPVQPSRLPLVAACLVSTAAWSPSTGDRSGHGYGMFPSGFRDGMRGMPIPGRTIGRTR